MPVVMAEVLVGVPGIFGLREVIATGTGGCWFGRDDNRVLIEVERHVALEADGIAQVVPGWEPHRASTRRGRSFDSAVDSGSVNRLAIPNCAENLYVINGGVRGSRRCLRSGLARLQRGSRNARARDTQEIAASSVIPRHEPPPKAS